MSIINPSPTVLVNGFDTTNGVDVLQGATVTIQLNDSAGVNVWQVRCLYTDEYHDADTINSSMVFDYVAKTATFTMPSDGYTLGTALLFESVVNQGVDINGNVIDSYRTLFGVFTTYGGALRISGLNETIEGSNDFGWVTKFNNAIRALGSSGVTFSASGDLAGSALVQQVVRINGSTVPIGGALTTGNVLQVAGVSTLSYAPVNLAGGANYVTGTLPTGNQAAQTMGGDVSGTTAAATVAKINATTVSTAGGALTTGQVLRVTGAATSDWGALNLANSSAVTGQLPTANQVVQTMLGDVTGTTAASVVEKLRGKLLATGLASIGAAEDGYILTWDNGLSAWKAGISNTTLFGDVTGPTTATVVTMGGDVTGTSGNTLVQCSGDVTGSTSSNTVARIRGQDLAAGVGTPGVGENGYVLTWNNSSGEYELAAQTGGTATTWADDLAGSTITSQKVVHITGTGGTSVNLGSGASFTVAIADKPDNGGSGGQLTIHSQNETGTTSTGGALALYSGSGTSQHGSVYIGTGNGSGHYIFIDGSNPAAGTGIRFSNFTNAYPSFGLITVDNSGNLGQTNYTSLGLAGDVTGTLGSSTVAKINATTVSTAGGSLSTGAVLRVTGAATADWGQLDLADTDAVTGLLPNANQAAQDVAGDVSGTTAATTVDKVKGTTITTAGGSLATGKVLRVTGLSTADWGAVDLADTDAVTGVLPTGNQAAQSMGGDVSGTTAASTVDKIKNKTLDASIGTAGAGQDQYVITWDNGTTSYKLLAPTGGSGVTTVGTFDSQASAANGLVISGVNIYAQSATASNPGMIKLAGDIGGTGAAPTVTDITGASGKVDISASGNIITWAAATTAPGIAQTSTSGGSGADMTIAAQGATGASNNGGGLILAGGTSGSATAGTVVVKTGGSTRLTVGATGVVTVANLGTGIVHSDSSGNLTSSTIVNADVSGSAAIDGTKIAPDFGSQNIVTTGTLTAKASTLGSTTTNNTFTGGNIWTTRTLAADLTIDTTTKDMIILCSTAAARNITLPAPVNGRMFIIKDSTGQAETNNITLIRNGSEQIEGVAASRTLSTNWGVWKIISDGTNWFFL